MPRLQTADEDSDGGNATPRWSLACFPDLRDHPVSALKDLCTILSSGYINALLIFLPFALISGAREWSPTVIFVTNFFAMMPLAALLSFATEELSKSVGPGVGALLNVTFGNATELIVGIVALRDGQVKLIQTTMLGSILSSLLFVAPPSFSRSLLRCSELHL
jgi:Ca2+:H+ antiporter